MVALLAMLAVESGCSSSAQVVAKPAPVAPTTMTPDDEVTSAREVAERTPAGPAADDAQAKLAVAIQNAIKFHADQAEMALAGHNLGEAESEIIAAASYDPSDASVVDLRGRAAEVRSKCTLSLGQVRGLIGRLKDSPPRTPDAALWQELSEALTTLAPWSSEFAEVTTLRAVAAPMLANWLAFLGGAAFDAGDSATAEKFLQAATAWHGNHASVIALRARLDSVGQVGVARAKVKAAVDAKQFELAVQLADEALQTFKEDAELRALRQTAATAAALAYVDAAKAALKAGAIAQTAAAVAAARQVAKDDTALGKVLDGIVKEFSKKVEKSLGGQAAADQSRGLGGAAYIKWLALRAVLGADAKRDAKIAKLDAELTLASRYLIGLQVAPLAKNQTKELPAAMPGQVANASQLTVRAALQGPELAGFGAAVLATGAGDATVNLAWPTWSVVRRREQETRVKDYLDHTETIHNVAWDAAISSQTSAMARMNAANDELRPVLGEVNAAEGKLNDLQVQTAEINKKIASDDEQYYKERPKPCPDGTAQCPQSWANKRWKTNLDYYLKRIDEENKKLEALVPKLNRLQAAADAGIKAYDVAVDAAERTPRKIPKEVWLPYSYEVTKNMLAVKVRGEFVVREGNAKTAAVLSQLTPALDEVRQDYTTTTVIVKGQVLESKHDSKLPEDVTLTAELVHRTLTPALAALREAIGRHGERWIIKSELAKTEGERVHYLMLAWRARGALTSDRRTIVAQRLRDNAGYDAHASTVDVSRLVLGK
ncbi:MAG: hypothetical protein EXR77_12885 [Myxococcales bacterium]|nr:hypothetical protein [Myxococcales bacterium]